MDGHLLWEVLDGGVVEAAPGIILQHSYAAPGGASVKRRCQHKAAPVLNLVIVRQQQHAAWQRCKVHLGRRHGK